MRTLGHRRIKVERTGPASILERFDASISNRTVGTINAVGSAVGVSNAGELVDLPVFDPENAADAEATAGVIIETAETAAEAAGTAAVIKGGVKVGIEVVAAAVKKDPARIGKKIASQMGRRRGWTQQQSDEAIKSGQQIPAINKATGNPAIRYIHPQTGQSVVVYSITNEVIHVGGPGFKYGAASEALQ